MLSRLHARRSERPWPLTKIGPVSVEKARQCVPVPVPVLCCAARSIRLSACLRGRAKVPRVCLNAARTKQVVDIMCLAGHVVETLGGSWLDWGLERLETAPCVVKL